MTQMSIDEVQQFIKARYMEGIADTTSLQSKMSEVQSFVNQHYGTMTPEAAAYVDKLTDGLLKMFESGVEKVPDSAYRRELVRQIGFANRKHFKAEGFLAALSAAPANKFAIVEAAPPVFCKVLQHVLDILFDATREPHHGVARFAIISLHYWCVDELLTAFHLSTRQYATQAYAHIRTVYELLDKIRLFREQPQWADVWAGEDSKKIWNELRPAKVRRRLGKGKEDPLNSFFSELGTHGTFSGVQARTERRFSADVKSHVGVTMWVGGVPLEEHIAFSVSYSIMATVSVMLSAVASFSQRLNEEDALLSLDSAIEVAVEFERKYFAGWASKAGVDMEAFLALINERPRVLEFYRTYDSV